MILHDKGRLFLTTMPIKRGLRPLVAGMWARMDEPPWRHGRGIAVRVWRGTALAFGLWGPARDITEVEGMLAAMSAPESWGRTARNAHLIGRLKPGPDLRVHQEVKQPPPPWA